jgi:hypothetical protein
MHIVHICSSERMFTVVQSAPNHTMGKAMHTLSMRIKNCAHGEHTYINIIYMYILSIRRIQNTYAEQARSSICFPHGD